MVGLLRAWVLLCSFVGTLIVGFLIASLISPDLPIRPLIQQDNPSRGADAIILLMGDPVDRVPQAVELLNQGYAPLILFAETETLPLMKLGLRKREGAMVMEYLTGEMKVPASKIRFLSDTKVSSTRDELEILMRELKRMQARRAIIVTSWYHSARAQWMADRLNKEGFWIQSFPSDTPTKWYQKEMDVLNVYQEYLKWPYYQVKYGLPR